MMIQSYSIDRHESCTPQQAKFIFDLPSLVPVIHVPLEIAKIASKSIQNRKSKINIDDDEDDDDDDDGDDDDDDDDDDAPDDAFPRFLR